MLGRSILPNRIRNIFRWMRDLSLYSRMGGVPVYKGLYSVRDVGPRVLGGTCMGGPDDEGKKMPRRRCRPLMPALEYG